MKKLYKNSFLIQRISKHQLLTIISTLFFINALSQDFKKVLEVEKQYLNIPIDIEQEEQMVKFVLEGDTLTYSSMSIAEEKPDYWVFLDISAWKGKELALVFNKKTKGIEHIFQSDKIQGADSLYKETYRPQFHFTSRRGWNNDPNGLVFYEGEYHLFYQHNPYKTHWGNMHWGHAVSKDLLHWKELKIALYPDNLGTMFSGSAIIDSKNTGGWGKNTMVAFYTSAGKEMTQNLAYSNDNGQTFTKYQDNPILGPNRDPKVFWYEPAKTWVMVLYEDNYFAIYNSKDLKDWEYKSKTKGFFECPELFELAVDEDSNNKKWVMYGASGTYMIGDFDGKEFTPESGKYFYSWGNQYAAQTFNNLPNERRIQIGWGRIEQPGMPFNQMMLFPAELTLRTTRDGVRLFCEPIQEIKNLHGKKNTWENMTGKEINEKLKNINHELMHVIMDVEILHGLGLEIFFMGNSVINYDGNFNRFNGAPYLCNSPGHYQFTIELLIDKTSVEGYIDKGKLFISEGLKKAKNKVGLQLKET